MGGSVEVDTVPLIEIGRKFLRIIDDDADASCTKFIHYRRNIGGAMFLGSEEAEIVAARLQDHNVSALGHGRVEAAQHAGRDIAGDASIGDVGLDPSLAQQRLQSGGIGISNPTPQPAVLLAPIATMLTGAASTTEETIRAAVSSKARRAKTIAQSLGGVRLAVLN